MSFEWEAEKTIETSLAKELIQKQFPKIYCNSIRKLGSGWDNTAFVIDEKLIFRFPRRQIALDLLESEWYILPKIANLLPLDTPFPKWKGEPTDRFPWPFIGYPMLPGNTACYVDLSDKQRDQMAKKIANFLLTLHGISSSIISDHQILNDNYSRIDKTCLIPKIKTNIEELSLLKLLDNRKKLEEILDDSKNLRAPTTSTLVHGDFYIRHLLVDEAHTLTGVIDWGDVHIGDPAIDLSIAHSFLPRKSQEKFKRVYGKISNDTWGLARLKAIHSSTYLMLFGYHSKDPDLLREGQKALTMITS